MVCLDGCHLLKCFSCETNHVQHATALEAVGANVLGADMTQPAGAKATCNTASTCSSDIQTWMCDMHRCIITQLCRFYLSANQSPCASPVAADSGALCWLMAMAASSAVLLSTTAASV